MAQMEYQVQKKVKRFQCVVEEQERKMEKAIASNPFLCYLLIV